MLKDRAYNVTLQVDPEKLKERFPIIQLFTFEWIIDIIWLIYRGCHKQLVEL